MHSTRPFASSCIGTDVSRDGFESDLGKGSFVPTLLSIAKSARALFELRLAEIGLHIGQDRLLAQLGARGPSSVSELAGLLDVRASTVSKMADRLQASGLLVRSGNPADARVTELCLTPAGEMVRDRVEALWQSVTNEMERSLGEGFAAVTREMRVLDRSLSAKLARLR